MIFKILPNVRIGWRDVGVGAASTALVWIYNHSCVLFFGAEFTKVWSRRFGPGVIPNSRAMLAADAWRAKLGLPPKPEIERREPRPAGHIRR